MLTEHLAAVLIAIIAGVFSIITLLIQKSQDKIITKIDEQTLLLEREKVLKRKLNSYEKKLGDITRRTIILLLKLASEIADNLKITGENITSIREESDELIALYSETSKELDAVAKEYEMIVDLSETFKKEKLSDSNRSKK